MERILFELSKEHPSLPMAEALSCLKAEEVDFKVLDAEDSFLEVISREADLKRVASRLSMTFHVDKLLFFSPPNMEEILSRARRKEINFEGTFRVSCRDRRKKKKNLRSIDIERELGKVYKKFGRVNLKNPDNEIRVLLTDSKWFVGIKIAEVDRSSFENRRAHQRPFFSPISMHPRLARAMVNLSLVKRGERLLDPFCGTGGILIEAGLIGAKILGGDIKKKMVEGCKINLKSFGLNDFEIVLCDVGEIANLFGKVDAIVTDFPYGRATSTNRENLSSLYPRAFEAIADVLRQGRRAVLALPSVDAVKRCSEEMKLVEVHKYEVHKSLTRYISVFVK